MSTEISPEAGALTGDRVWREPGRRAVSGAGDREHPGGRIDVFVQGNNDALYTRALPPGGSWSPWQLLGGTLNFGPAAQPGAVVLMHIGSNPDDGTTLTAASLPQIIDGLRAQGYQFVTHALAR